MQLLVYCVTMASRLNNLRSSCPINFALELLGDKWTLLIIRDLIFKGKCSFLEFRKSDEKIATNILTDRLRKLEQYGFITKSVSSQNKSKFEYTLQPIGQDLMPVLLELFAWGAKHNPDLDFPDGFIEHFEKNKEQMLLLLSEGTKS